MWMFGRRAYSNMCGCRDCGNDPHTKSSMRRYEKKQWHKDFEDEELYPELEEIDE
jgi:hypothetical protein